MSSIWDVSLETCLRDDAKSLHRHSDMADPCAAAFKSDGMYGGCFKHPFVYERKRLPP